MTHDSADWAMMKWMDWVGADHCRPAQQTCLAWSAATMIPDAPARRAFSMHPKCQDFTT